MYSTIDSVYDNIIRNRLIESGDKVLIGLSGGADSVFMLCVLSEIKKKLNFDIACAHLNHGIRGSEADHDQKFCAELCDRMNVDFHTCKLNIPYLSRKNKLSEETCGRIERYSFFKKICEVYNLNKIAVAHNMNDSVETTIINLMRGASLKGLCGIEFKNGDIIRPILNITRDEIETYLKDRNISFCTDSTNSSTDYTRNMVRHEIINKMKSINPSIIGTIYNNSLNLKDDNDFLNNYVNDLNCVFSVERDVYISKSVFDCQHISIKKRLIIKAFSMLIGNSMNISSTHIDILTQNSSSGKVYHMPHNVNVCSSFDYLIFTKSKTNDAVDKITFVPGKTINFTDGIKVSSEFVDEADFSKPNCIYIDYDSLNSKTLFLRSKKDGDKFIPFGMNSSKKLKQLFAEMKIPVNKRFSVPVLCDENHIIAIIPYRISDLHKINDNTKRILKIQLSRED